MSRCQARINQLLAVELRPRVYWSGLIYTPSYTGSVNFPVWLWDAKPPRCCRGTPCTGPMSVFGACIILSSATSQKRSRLDYANHSLHWTATYWTNHQHCNCDMLVSALSATTYQNNNKGHVCFKASTRVWMMPLRHNIDRPNLCFFFHSLSSSLTTADELPMSSC